MESVEDFIKRGGRIRRVPVRPVRPEKLPPGEALRRRLTREKRNVGLE